MAGTYYHQEALRKARLIERKTEAMRRLQETMGDSNEGPGIVESKPSNLVFSESGHYAQNRSDNIKSWEKNEVVFEEVVHDPNFKYRILKDSGNTPVHVDPIYKILYPGGVTRKSKLEKFRVNSAGFDNRYRHRDNLNPHCDLAYAVVYPGKDNSDYTNDYNRNNRIMNKNIEMYEISRKINGPAINNNPDSFFEVSPELEFSKYPPEQTNRKKFVRRKEDIIRKPTPESVRKIPRDQIYSILHPNR